MPILAFQKCMELERIVTGLMEELKSQEQTFNNQQKATAMEQQQEITRLTEGHERERKTNLRLIADVQQVCATIPA